MHSSNSEMLAVTQRYITPPESGDEEAASGANQNMKSCRYGAENQPNLTEALPPRPSHLPPRPPPLHPDDNAQVAGSYWPDRGPVGEAIAVAPERYRQDYNYSGYEYYGWDWRNHTAGAPLLSPFASTCYSYGTDRYALQQSQQAYGYSHYSAPAGSIQFNPDAQDFVPLETSPQAAPVAESLLARLSCINKKARDSPETSSGGKSAPTKKLSKKQKKAGAKTLTQVSPEPELPPSAPAVKLHQSAVPQALQLKHSKGTAKPKQSHTQRRENAPRLQMLDRPEPTVLYSVVAAQEPQVLPSPRPLLVVIDLNGTLLKRTKYSGSNSFIPRPYLDQFLHYVLANHKLMIWSSARPENVATMCSNLFTQEERDQLVAVWARDTLRLPKQAYYAKVQVYKQLSWIWNDTAIQLSHPDKSQMWSQSNTVLIDDSIEKAASEPHNLLAVEEFSAEPEQMKWDTYLGEAMHYLHILSTQADVSAYMKKHPFRLDREGRLIG